MRLNHPQYQNYKWRYGLAFLGAAEQIQQPPQRRIVRAFQLLIRKGVSKKNRWKFQKPSPIPPLMTRPSNGA